MWLLGQFSKKRHVGMIDMMAFLSIPTICFVCLSSECSPAATNNFNDCTCTKHHRHLPAVMIISWWLIEAVETLEVAGPSKPWNLQRRFVRSGAKKNTHARSRELIFIFYFCLAKKSQVLHQNLMLGGEFSPTHPEKYAQVKLDPISQFSGWK